MKKHLTLVVSILLVSLTFFACATVRPISARVVANNAPRVLAVESFLADITRNVAGDRVKVETLIPLGMDPHGFEPTPQDIVKIANSDLLIINGAGLEAWLEQAIQNVSSRHAVIVSASQGLVAPADRPDDPHFWLDPVNTIRYAENIRDAMITADPAGEQEYRSNTAAYIQKLTDLDFWIRQQVAAIPVENRILITNHESLGYFADRYGFTVAGTILESASSLASPSARHLAQLVDLIKSSHVQAIFLETGSNTQLAEQIAAETGIKVVTDLLDHSITTPDGPAPTYIDMIHWDTKTIVEALTTK